MNFLLFITGLCIGSFLGALTYRFPRNVSVLKGRSWCDTCHKKIEWWENIPLLSYIFLTGKCKGCNQKISVRYPLIELATGILFVVFGLNFYLLALVLILEIIFVIDFEHQIIPDFFVFTGIVVVLINIFVQGLDPYSPLLAGFLSASFLLLIFLFTRGGGMGLGDVKFAVLGGLIVGLKMSVVYLFSAFLTGAVVGIILILASAAKLKSKIAFGPFLVIAIPITLIWGEKLFKYLK